MYVIHNKHTFVHHFSTSVLPNVVNEEDVIANNNQLPRSYGFSSPPLTPPHLQGGNEYAHRGKKPAPIVGGSNLQPFDCRPAL